VGGRQWEGKGEKEGGRTRGDWEVKGGEEKKKERRREERGGKGDE
jgi:hypothetical protein